MISIKNIEIDGLIYKQFKIASLSFRIRNKRREEKRAINKLLAQMNGFKHEEKSANVKSTKAKTSILVNKGKGNRLYILKNGERIETDYIEGLRIEFIGRNSTVEIAVDPMITFSNTCIKMGHDGLVKFGSSKHHCRDVVVVNTATNAKLLIGDDFSVDGAYISNTREPNLNISIGDDCLFSSEIYFRATYGHTIYDTNTREILNKPNEDSICVGNHVWICNGARVLKNSSIASNTIVGNRAIVTRCYDKESTAIAGTPAKIVKENVNWDRRGTNMFDEKL